MSTDSELRVMRAMARWTGEIRDGSDYRMFLRHLDDIEQQARLDPTFDIAGAINAAMDRRIEAQRRARGLVE